ncbi:unnamed protein product [Discosporangium mesarthrocarpum]
MEAKWWKDLVETEDTYSPATYSEGPSVSINHGIMKGLRHRDYDVDDDMYLYGIITTGAIFVIVGFVGCVITPCLCYGSGRWRKRYCRASRKYAQETKEPSTMWKWPVLLVCTVAMASVIAAVYGAIVSDFSLSDIAHSANAAAEDIREVMDIAGEVSSATGSSQDVLSSVLTITETCALEGDKSLAVVQSAGSFLEKISGYVLVAKSSGLTNLSANIEKVAWAMNSTTMVRQAMVWPTLALSFLILGASIIATWKHYQAMADGSRRDVDLRLNYLVWPLGLILTTCSWLVAAAALSLSALTGDFCVDPSTNLTEQLSNKELAAYYTGDCTGPNSLVQAMTTAEALAVNAISAFMPALKDVVSSCPAATRDSLALERGLYDLYTKLSAEVYLTSCRNMNSYYDNAVHNNMCGVLGESLIVLWVSLVVLSVLLFVLLWLWSITVARPRTTDKMTLGSDEGGEGYDTTSHPSSSPSPGPRNGDLGSHDNISPISSTQTRVGSMEVHPPPP